MKLKYDICGIKRKARLCSQQQEAQIHRRKDLLESWRNDK